ncbi:MAG: hypothetical protein HC808_11170 [Candidatus Competibacteraceae bacterium]|nr:hypothetical protein [Candidatus Competibacteraceae bacterium]
MHLIRKDYRIATVLLSVPGVTITALWLAFGQAVADQPQVNRMSKPTVNVVEAQGYTSTLLTAVQAVRMMNAATTSQPLNPSVDSSERHEQVASTIKQRKLERLLAYHKAMSGTLIARDAHYAIAKTIEHQPSPPDAIANESQAGKATVARAEPVTSKSFIANTDTML